MMVTDFQFASSHVIFFRVDHGTGNLLVSGDIILKAIDKSSVEVMFKQQCEREGRNCRH